MAQTSISHVTLSPDVEAFECLTYLPNLYVLTTDHVQSIVFRHDRIGGTNKQPGCTPVPNDVPSSCPLFTTPSHPVFVFT